MTKYLENVSSVSAVIAASVTESAPQKVTLPLYGSTLLEVWLWADAASFISVYLNDGQNRMLPVNGWLKLPNAVLSIDLERVLSGPPYSLGIFAINSDAATHGIIVVAKAGDVREIDADVRAVNELTEIKGILERVTLKKGI